MIMLIDISTYVGHWPFRNLRYNTLQGLDELAQRNGITHMVVSNLNGLFYKDANTANLELLEALKAYDGKTVFLPLAIVNPTYIQWEKDARNMIEAGFAGFEMAPLYHGYSLGAEMLPDTYLPQDRASKVMDLAEELDVPVRICSGFENFRGRSPLDTFENLKAEDYYKVLSKNLNTHVFVTSFHPGTAGENLGALLKERKNTYFDTTQFETFNSIHAKRVANILMPEQICFGSLSPFNYIESNLLKITYTPEFNYDMIRSNPARAFKSLR